MKMKKVAAILLTAVMSIGLLAGCGASEGSNDTGNADASGEQITLNYWTWFPSTDQIEETVAAFEKENPNKRI